MQKPPVAVGAPSVRNRLPFQRWFPPMRLSNEKEEHDLVSVILEGVCALLLLGLVLIVLWW